MSNSKISIEIFLALQPQSQATHPTELTMISLVAFFR